VVDNDLPILDETIVQLPSDIREDLANRGRQDLFFFNAAVMGHRDVTEDCHGPLCAFLDLNPTPFKMILMPRDHMKTSVITVAGTAQKVVQDSNHRILLANESGENASRMLGTIKQHAESNPVFRALYSSIIPKDTKKVPWNSNMLQFNREWRGPEPTIDSIGMTGAFTSRHYTHICYDDPISEEAVRSEKVMEDTIGRLASGVSLLVKPGEDSIWLVGTRWALWDCYSDWIRKLGVSAEGGKVALFARGAIEYGEPIWPERFPLEVLAMKRAAYDSEYKWSCLMMNNPRNPELQDLNVEDLRVWEWANSQETRVRLFDKTGAIAREYELDQLDITCSVDPAAAEKRKDDRNAIVTVGVTPYNEAIVLDAWGKRCTPLEVINHLFDVKKRFHPRVFGIEDVGYQKTLKVFLNYFAEQQGVYFNIMPLKAIGKKDHRIRAIQPYMATGRVYMRGNQFLLRQEIADYPLGKHEDVLEAFSMHTMMWRGQMSPESRTKFREQEQKLINRIQKQNTSSMALAPARDFDLDEVPDEFDRPNLPISETRIA